MDNNSPFPGKYFFDGIDTKNRFTGLDLLRFIACFAIIVFHYQHFSYVQPGIKISSFVLSDGPFYNIFFIFYRAGSYGVHLFWALSGFVFFALFLKKIEKGTLSFRFFFIDRFSRLYPLHLLFLIIISLLVLYCRNTMGSDVIYKNNDLYHFILNILFIPKVFPNNGWSFNAPVWSVTVEVFAYLAFFLYAKFKKSFCYSSLLYLILFLLIAYPNTFITSAALNNCIAVFFLGGFTYSFLYGLSCRFSLIKSYIISSLFLLLSLLFIHKIIILILLVILIFSFPLNLGKIDPLKNKIFTILGNITYAMYLSHVSLQIIYFILIQKFLHLKMHEVSKNPYFFILYVATLLIISTIIYYFFELPCKKNIRRVLRSTFSRNEDYC